MVWPWLLRSGKRYHRGRRLGVEERGGGWVVAGRWEAGGAWEERWRLGRGWVEV
jgi:hypothetical protein